MNLRISRSNTEPFPPIESTRLKENERVGEEKREKKTELADLNSINNLLHTNMVSLCKRNASQR